MTIPGLLDLRTAWLDWTVSRALPLWFGSGFSPELGLFEEQLEFDGRPVLDVPLRLMVQCRQIAVLCLAQSRGWFPGAAALARAAGTRIIERYFEVDGVPGWIFSIDRDGRPCRTDRDLYTHAFVLFAFAWLHRAAPDPEIQSAIDATVAFLDLHLADRAQGGFVERLPDAGPSRRQDPLMHLFEAFLELHAATGEVAYLDRAAALRSHVLDNFYDEATDTLREELGPSWEVAPDSWRVEPGHHFEWAWLLRRFDRLSGQSPGRVGTALIDTALRFGVDRDRGRLIDQMAPDGSRRQSSSRLWPHTEAIRGLNDPAFDQLRGTIIDRLLSVYCPRRLNGGWVDRLDESDRPVSTTMPASSLYHLAFALAEIDPVAAGG